MCHTKEGRVSAIPLKRENFYIISYDISVNRIRTKIANELKNYGRRVQYSVFECELSEKKFWELYGKLALLLQQAQDQGISSNQGEKEEELRNRNQDMSENSSNSIRVYRLCSTCIEQIRVIGVEQRKKEDSDIIII